MSGYPQENPISADTTVTAGVDGVFGTAPQFWLGYTAKPGYVLDGAPAQGSTSTSTTAMTSRIARPRPDFLPALQQPPALLKGRGFLRGSPHEPQRTPTHPFAETLRRHSPTCQGSHFQSARPVPSAGNPIMVEKNAVASDQPLETKTTGRPSLTRITIAFFTLGLSIPFIGIHREHGAEYYK